MYNILYSMPVCTPRIQCLNVRLGQKKQVVFKRYNILSTKLCQHNMLLLDIYYLYIVLYV